MQFISPEGDKKYKGGTDKRGHFYIIPGKEDIIVICEGYATGASIYLATGYIVIIAFDAGNLLPVGKNIQAIYPKGDIIFAADDDWKTAGNPGQTKAFEAAQAVNGKVAVPHLPAHRKEKDTDFNDLHLLSGLKAVKMCIDNAANWKERISKEQLDKLYKSTIQRLARLSSLEYELNRKKEAGGLGISVNLLDKEVKAARNNGEEKLPFTVYSPCSEPINPASLLDTVADTIKSYVVCSQEIIDAAALWVAFTWFADYSHIAPYLFITSPEKECGKSTLKDAIKVLSFKAIDAGNITAAVLYRMIEKYHPTVFLDDGDSYLKDNEDLRGILNFGHRRGTKTPRMGGVNRDLLQFFDTYGPKCIVAIKDISSTLESRSIICRMERKLGSEKVKRFPGDEVKVDKTFGPLCSQLARFAADYSDKFKELMERDDPPSPKELGNRAKDNWENLLPALFTTEILEWLNGEDEDGSFRRWADFSKGKGINSRGLGKMLREFSIVSGTVNRTESQSKKGYQREDVESSYDRYIGLYKGNSDAFSSDTQEQEQRGKEPLPSYNLNEEDFVSD